MITPDSTPLPRQLPLYLERVESYLVKRRTVHPHRVLEVLSDQKFTTYCHSHADVARSIATLVAKMYPSEKTPVPLNKCWANLSMTPRLLPMIQAIGNRIQNHRTFMQHLFNKRNAAGLIAMINKGHNPFVGQDCLSIKKLDERFTRDERLAIIQALSTNKMEVPWSILVDSEWVFSVKSLPILQSLIEQQPLLLKEKHLMWAAVSKNMEGFKELLALGLDPHDLSNGPILHVVIDSVEWVKYLITECDINIRQQVHPRTNDNCFHACATMGSYEVFCLLKKSTLEGLTALNRARRTPLHKAFLHSNAMMIRALIEGEMLSSLQPQGSHCAPLLCWKPEYLSPEIVLPILCGELQNEFATHENVVSVILALGDYFAILKEYHILEDRIYCDAAPLFELGAALLNTHFSFVLPQDPDRFAVFCGQNMALSGTYRSFRPGEVSRKRKHGRGVTVKYPAIAQLQDSLGKAAEKIRARQEAEASEAQSVSYTERFQGLDIFALFSDVAPTPELFEKTFGVGMPIFYSVGLLAGEDLLALSYPVRLEEALLAYDANPTPQLAAEVAALSALEQQGTNTAQLWQYLRDRKVQLVKRYLAQFERDYTAIEEALNGEGIANFHRESGCSTEALFALFEEEGPIKKKQKTQ